LNNPLCSIIITNCNYSDYISECILSACNQTYQNIKIVVVDDGSSDSSPEKIKYLAEKDSRIVPIYRKVCGGASRGRNDAINKVWDETDYFLMLDSDDTIHPDKVRQCLQKIMVSPSVGLVYTDYDVKNQITGNITREFKEPFDLRRLQQDCIVHSGFMCSKEAFDKIKEIDEDGKYQWYDPVLHGPLINQDGSPATFQGSCEDYAVIQAIATYFMCIHLPLPLSTVRVHGKNASDINKVRTTWTKNVEYMQKKALARQGKI
jgi:glycosyltransferase involved in cell wall biosynthesis